MEITREEIDRIIKSGTPMERIRLYYTHEALINWNKEGFLTDEDKRTIDLLFNRTTADRNLWNKYFQIDQQAGQSFIYISQLTFAYLEQVARVTGYEMLWVEIIRKTALLNNILDEVEDKDLKCRIIDKIVKAPHLFHNYTKAKDEDYVNYNVAPDFPLQVDLNKLIKTSRSSMENLLRLAKPYLKAFREYLSKKKFMIPPYKETLQKQEDVFKTDRALFSEFSKIRYTKQQIEKYRYPEGTVIDSDKFIYPTYKDIPLDEALYKHYKEEIFI